MVAQAEIASAEAGEGERFAKPALLLTDIEGSTRLLERDPSAYRQALARHHEIIRAVTQRFAGQEFQDAGDGFFLAFSSPVHAAHAAMEMQQELSKVEWPRELGRLCVRMAVHWDEAEYRGGQYRGPVVHRAARLMSAAHGGQILCSHEAAQGLSDQFSVTRLGVYRLRGFNTAEAVYQLGVSGDFPPLRAAQARRHNLPQGKGFFIGRENELRELEKKLAPESGSRLVTLTGPGGVGKTRLSLAVAERLLDAYEHSVLYVALEAAVHSSAIPEGILQALKVPFESERESVAKITTLLTDLPTLIVLDNLEQLSAEGALMVARLCRELPCARFLVTSRSPLGLAGEATIPVSPFPLPTGDTLREIAGNDAVRFFMDRVTRVRPGFVLDAGNAREVGGICRMLDGLPLALELAAARMQVLTASELLESLKRVDPQAGDGNLGVLEGVFDWSVQMLPPDCANFLGNLSVFRGGWTAQSATAVCGLDEASLTLAYLHFLLTNSLIQATEKAGGMRFTMLEPIRQLAGLHFREDRASTVSRHGTWFRRLCRRINQEFGTAKETELVEEIEPETANILEALEREKRPQEQLFAAVDFHEFALHRGCNRQVRELLVETAQKESGEVRAQTLARAWNAAGSLDQVAHDLEGADSAFRQAILLFDQCGETHAAMAARCNLAAIAMEQGEHERAREIFLQTLRYFREQDATAYCATILHNLGVLARRLNRLDEAQEFIEECLVLSDKTGDPGLLADALLVRGELQNRTGEASAARRTLARSLELHLSLSRSAIFPSLFSALAENCYLEGDTKNAAAFLGGVNASPQRNGFPLSAETVETVEKLLKKCRTELGETGLQTHLERGLSLAPTDFLQIALSNSTTSTQ